MNKIDFKLYLITNRKLCKYYTLYEVIKRAINSGLKSIQVRENDLPVENLIELMNQIITITSKTNTKIFINNNLNIINKVNVDGIHCKDDGELLKLTRNLFPNHLIGASCHSLNSACQAEVFGADFIVFGPVYSTPSKIKYGQPQGISKLKEITSSVKLPVFAIGGIIPERVNECLNAGAYGVAVISAIMSAKNISEMLYKYEKELGSL